VRGQVYTSYGGPEVLELRRDLPETYPGAHEVLVEIRASSVNPVDWKIRRGNLRHVMRQHLPAIPGRDFCGIVIACGSRATSVARGDHVFGLCRLRGPGSHAERVSVSESRLALAPTRLACPDAAALPLAGLTAIQAIESAGVRRNHRILVQGGGGAVGSLIVQYAVHLGATVYTTVGSRNVDYARSLGAEPIDYRLEQFEQRVNDLDAVIDCVGGEIERRSFEVVRRGGKVVGVAGPDPEGRIDLRTLAKHGLGTSFRLLEQLARGRRYAFVSVRVDHQRLAQLAQLVDKGVLDVRIDRTYPLEQLAEAHRASERGTAVGKLIIDHQSNA
jgi:NADPH:quinone reductase-like Zn-dependent oxidoreductase